MIQQNTIAVLSDLFTRKFKEKPRSIVRTGNSSGSPRQYYRLTGNSITCIGTYHPDIEENLAFLYLSDHFRQNRLPVPEVYISDKTKQWYLQQDLGDCSLFSLIKDGITPDHFPILEKTLELLAQIQFTSSRSLNFDHCFPVPTFNKTSAGWDLHYFKYLFLKPSVVRLNESLLEQEFSVLLHHLFDHVPHAFMFRDFQSRNIMIHQEQPWFIDYQGGRKGHPAYDVASFLYQSRIAIGPDKRQRLLEHYLEYADPLSPVRRDEFMEKYPAFALLRLLQTLGAYGFRGLIEKKPLFIKPISHAIRNTLTLISELPDNLKPAYISSILNQLLPEFESIDHHPQQLTITIQSFSYMHGIPPDPSGNGGGYVFDCRALPNPHRDLTLRPLTGRDTPVQQWFKDRPEVDEFLNHCCQLVHQSISNYRHRGFEHLQINFGCTGGKHRSVFCAEKLSHWLKSQFHDIQIQCLHLGPDFRQQ